MTRGPAPMRRPTARRLRAGIPLAAGDDDFVEIDHPPAGPFRPVEIRPRRSGIDLAAWIAAHRAMVETWLAASGAVLLRGFDLEGADEFRAAVDAFGCEPMRYVESATPRTEIAERLYTSTEFPADQHIHLHNENSSARVWPMKLWLFCQTPATEGGETPLADMRRVAARLPDAMRARFEAKGWAVVRNYGDGFGLPWQTAFGTHDRDEVARYCRQADVDFEWRPGGRLRTCQRRPALRRHPRTGETVWFNHVAFWHVSSLDPEMRRTLEGEFAPDDLPFNTYYGDLEPIDDDTVETIRDAHRAESFVEPWRRSDMVVLDNMLVAHGRRPFRGPRRVLVMMGEASDAMGRPGG